MRRWRWTSSLLSDIMRIVSKTTSGIEAAYGPSQQNPFRPARPSSCHSKNLRSTFAVTTESGSSTGSELG